MLPAHRQYGTRNCRPNAEQRYYRNAQPGYGGPAASDPNNCGTPDEPKPCYGSFADWQTFTSHSTDRSATMLIRDRGQQVTGGVSVVERHGPKSSHRL